MWCLFPSSSRCCLAAFFSIHFRAEAFQCTFDVEACVRARWRAGERSWDVIFNYLQLLECFTPFRDFFALVICWGWLWLRDGLFYSLRNLPSLNPKAVLLSASVLIVISRLIFVFFLSVCRSKSNPLHHRRNSQNTSRRKGSRISHFFPPSYFCSRNIFFLLLLISFAYKNNWTFFSYFSQFFFFFRRK